MILRLATEQQSPQPETWRFFAPS